MTYVLSDIHGNLNILKKMLEKLNLKSDDVLYILGDVVDRGPNGVKCLQYIMKSKNIIMIMGNHEDMMLNYFNTYTKNNMHLWYHNGGEATHNEYNELKDIEKIEILEYIKNLPLYLDIKVNNRVFELVHANYLENKKNIGCTMKERLMWSRIGKFERGPENKIIIFGHTPTESYFNRQDIEKEGHLMIWKKYNLIGIDCGMAGYTSNYPYSCLGCLCLDTMEEFYVK